MAVKAKEFGFAVELERGGRVSSEDGTAIEPAESWTPEHLLLAALLRCSVASLRHHARSAGSEAVARGSAVGKVTRQEGSGRYAFVELDVQLDVELEPAAADLPALLAKAERDCFIGASLTVKPRYRWTVNSARVEPS